MKKILLVVFVLCSFFAKAQKVENIYVNLYTDSLKKGTFNYINIDGKLSNGNFLPLDSNHLLFWASSGKFNGNSLWIDNNISVERVDIKVSLKNNPSVVKEFSIYIKQQPDPELKSMDELMNKSKTKRG